MAQRENREFAPGVQRMLGREDFSALASRMKAPACACEVSDPFALPRAASRLRHNIMSPSEIAEGAAL